jgi:hypothetical protein
LNEYVAGNIEYKASREAAQYWAKEITEMVVYFTKKNDNELLKLGSSVRQEKKYPDNKKDRELYLRQRLLVSGERLGYFAPLPMEDRQTLQTIIDTTPPEIRKEMQWYAEDQIRVMLIVPIIDIIVSNNMSISRNTHIVASAFPYHRWRAVRSLSEVLVNDFKIGGINLEMSLLKIQQTINSVLGESEQKQSKTLSRRRYELRDDIVPNNEFVQFISDATSAIVTIVPSIAIAMFFFWLGIIVNIFVKRNNASGVLTVDNNIKNKDK